MSTGKAAFKTAATVNIALQAVHSLFAFRDYGVTKLALA